MSMIGGLSSGLDTASIIEQLIAVERIPQTLLTQRKTTLQATVDAYSSIRTRLSTLDTAANALRRPEDWQVRSAAADSSAVTVSATAQADLGSLSFTIDALAARHSVRSGNTIAATTDVIASGGSIQITNSTGTTSLSVGSGTLAEVVSAVNASNLGLSAAAVNTGSGFRLQLSARTSGAAATFSVSGGLDPAVGGMAVAVTGADAQLTIGSGPGAYAVTSSSNTFADILPGVTVTARSTSASPVTVTVTDNVDALVTKMQALVDAASAVRTEINTRTSYNAEAKQAASLAGDPSTRRVAQDLVRALTDAVASSPLGAAGAAGVSIDRFGKVTFDASKFRLVYETNPASVRTLFTSSTSASGDVSFVAAGDRTAPGSHAVAVTAAATAASATGLVGGWPLAEPTTVSVRIGDTTASYTIQPTDSDTDAAAGLQAAATGAGLSLSVSAEGGGLRVSRPGVGSTSTFAVAWDGSNFTTHSGTDVAGTIGGVAAIGTGSTLTAPLSANAVGGLSVRVADGATGAVGSVTYQPGVAQRLASVVDRAIDTVDGYLTSRVDGQNRRITDINRSISAFEIRLEARETRLRLQFATLEVTLGELSSRSNWLSGQLGSLNANNRGGQ
jgi:flagellar hook-associated protein 2